jgi:hypothetical protein
VVSASKFGIILIQIDAAGTYSSKVPAATPTTAMAYTSAALALAALPSADSGNVAVGYIAIAADSGGWTGITDDMTNGSDLTTATFVDAAEPVSALVSEDCPFISGSVTPALSGTAANLRGGSTESIVLLYTSDGSGAVTNGKAIVSFRPLGMAGDTGVELSSRS